MWWPAKGGRRLCTKVAYCTYVCGVYMRTRVRKNGGEVNDRVYEGSDVAECMIVRVS